jgi:hypothetical protein
MMQNARLGKKRRRRWRIEFSFEQEDVDDLFSILPLSILLRLLHLWQSIINPQSSADVIRVGELEDIKWDRVISKGTKSSKFYQIYPHARSRT